MFLSAFCEFFGNTIHNQVVEYLCEAKTADFSASGLAMQVQISRPKAYEYLYHFMKCGIIKKTRIVAGTQLFAADLSHPRMQQYLHIFEYVVLGKELSSAVSQLQNTPDLS